MNPGDMLTTCPFQATNQLRGDLKDYRGQWVVLYFYPKDATPGCTQEGRDFADNLARFTALNAVVLGVSRDSLQSHENFKTKQQFPFELISDKDEKLCQQFDVIKMKSMYGKQVRGIERSTFIIDPMGMVKHAFRKVSVPGHVEIVLNTLQTLQSR